MENPWRGEEQGGGGGAGGVGPGAQLAADRHSQGCSQGTLPGSVSAQLAWQQGLPLACSPHGGVHPTVRWQGDSEVLSIAACPGGTGLA